MRKLTFVLILLLVNILQAKSITPSKSKVTNATVFKNRALVSRELTIDCPKGKHTINITKLTNDLQDKSVRVSTRNQEYLKIIDVNVRKEFTSQIQNDKIKKMQLQIDSLKRVLQICRDNISVYNSKKDFTESLKAESIKYVNKRILLDTASPKNWNDMLQFVDQTLQDIYVGLRYEENKRREIEQQIKAIENNKKRLGGKKTKSFKEVTITVDNRYERNIKLDLSYLVNKAHWYPIYDARVSKINKEAELHYFGMIQQSTGEDWNNINLTLSTAEPLSIKTIPELDSWFLSNSPLPRKQPKSRYKVKGNFELNYEENWGYEKGYGAISGYITDDETGGVLPGANIVVVGTTWGASTDINGKFLIPNLPESNYKLKIQFIGYSDKEIDVKVVQKNIAKVNVPLYYDVLDGEAVVVTAQSAGQLNAINQQLSSRTYKKTTKKPKLKFTNVHAKNLSTVFEIPTKYSIPSDNHMHKVTIAINDLPIEFNYTSVPKEIEKVYLQGAINNNTNFPFLDGELNVFVDNDFINRTFINTITPTDTFKLALGVDQNINITKNLINKYYESKGLFNSNNKITYHYEIIITNHRATEENILIYEQVPIPMNENIKVELIDPPLKIDELNQKNEIKWNKNIKPGEKIVLPLKFSIEFPKDSNIYGLE